MRRALWLCVALVGCGGGEEPAEVAPVDSAGSESEAAPPEVASTNGAEAAELFQCISLGPTEAGRARLSTASYEDADVEAARGACLSVLEAMFAGSAETFDLDRHCLERLRQLAEATDQPAPDVSGYEATRQRARAERLANAPPLPEGFSPETGERTYTGTLTDDDPRLPGANTPYDEYRIDLAEGTNLSVDMVSQEFDCYLWLLDDAGRELTHDDDGGEGLNSHFEYHIARSGSFLLRANAYGNTDRGAYELHVTIEQ